MVKGGTCCDTFFLMSSTRFQTLREPIRACHYRHWPKFSSLATVHQEFFSTTTSQKTESGINCKVARSLSPIRRQRRDSGSARIQSNTIIDYTSSSNNCGSNRSDDKNVRPYSGSLPSPGYEWCKRCNIPDKRFQIKIGATNKCLDRPRIFGLGICHKAKRYYWQQLYVMVILGSFCFAGICTV